MSTITVLTGSHRAVGESTRIGDWFAGELEGRGHTVHRINLAEVELPMWDEGMWGVDGLKEKWAEHWAPLSEKLKASEGLVCVAPEYAGMVPAKLKNFFLFPGQNELGHKAGLIVSVSASINGAYPVAELRSHTVKNCKLCWTPEHVIVRSASEMFTESSDNPHAEATTTRAKFALDVFEEYVSALNSVRASGRVLNSDYPFGQ